MSEFRKISHRVYLLYLGVLPSLASFALLARYGARVPFIFILFGGLTIVSVYIVSLSSYSRPAGFTKTLFLLVDGLVFAFLAFPKRGVDLSFAIDNFIIEGTAVWLAIAWLAVTTSRPAPEQRIATLIFFALAVGTMVVLALPYIQEYIWGNWEALFWLAVGIVEAFFVQNQLLFADQVVAGDEKFKFAFNLSMIILWAFALIAGNLAYELR